MVVGDVADPVSVLVPVWAALVSVAVWVSVVCALDPTGTGTLVLGECALVLVVAEPVADDSEPVCSAEVVFAGVLSGVLVSVAVEVTLAC